MNRAGEDTISKALSQSTSSHSTQWVIFLSEAETAQSLTKWKVHSTRQTLAGGSIATKTGKLISKGLFNTIQRLGQEGEQTGYLLTHYGRASPCSHPHALPNPSDNGTEKGIWRNNKTNRRD